MKFDCYRSKVQKKIYRCAICSFQTKHRQSLHHHKKVHWAPEKRQMFTCAKCDKKYRLKKSLQCHLKRDHLDSRNSDSTSPTDEVILGSLKMEIDDYTPHLDDFKNAEHLAVTNKVKSEVFLKIEPDGVTPTMNTDMQDDFKNTENLSVTKKLYIKLEDFIKMEPKYDDEDARF
ncbi:uncharacterized protein LOC115888638 [Sitophilus oryzae]|uniref:Uncharacterized protein LOC115888638 n=1 Tax=Sitophilus oryzae TaxID=7048 RepID=A0A6J2YM69_SITOR|nr:uncharacterized protein LOC115888638 [Sitophilus oryzae]